MERMFDDVKLLDREDGELSAVPTERLEAEMMTLAGHLAAAMCSFLLLVAEFDRREGWASWECLSTAQWLNWKCGVGMSAAREQVRVARRLGELPMVRDEFSSGRLSYSKVRAITRVATPEIEAGLVRMAQSATAAQMDEACRALRRTQDLEAAEAELRTDEDAAQARRSVSWSRTGCEFAIRALLGAEDAELVLRAIEAATEDEDGRVRGEDLDQRRADALVRIAAAYLSNPDPGEPGGTAEVVVHVDATAAELARRQERCRDDPAPERTADRSMLGCAIAGAPAPDGRADEEPVAWPVTTSRGAPMSFAALERLACDCGRRMVIRLPDGSELNLGRRSRTVNRAQRRALLARDKRCRFPGCHRRTRLRAHHNIVLDGAGGRWHGEQIDWDCFFATFAN